MRSTERRWRRRIGDDVHLERFGQLARSRHVSGPSGSRRARRHSPQVHGQHLVGRCRTSRARTGRSPVRRAPRGSVPRSAGPASSARSTSRSAGANRRAPSPAEKRLLAPRLELGDEVVDTSHFVVGRRAVRLRAPFGTARSRARCGAASIAGTTNDRAVAQRVRKEVEARDRDHRNAQHLRQRLGGGDADAQSREQAGADTDRDRRHLIQRDAELVAAELDGGRELFGVPGRTRVGVTAELDAREQPVFRREHDADPAGGGLDAEQHQPRARSVSAASTAGRRGAPARAVVHELEHPLVLAGAGPDPHDQVVGRNRLLDEVAPLHERHAVAVDDLVETELVKVLEAIEAVHVDVREPQPALVQLHDRERRARHRLLYAQAACQTLRERGLARAQVAHQQHDVAGYEQLGQRGRDRARVASADSVRIVTPRAAVARVLASRARSRSAPRPASCRPTAVPPKGGAWAGARPRSPPA